VSLCSLEQNQIMKGAVFWDVTLSCGRSY